MNTRLLLDGSASVQDSYRYDAFGQVIDQHGAVPNPFLYDGQQYDAGTGLYYRAACYMDPTTGRFLQHGPRIRLPGRPDHLPSLPLRRRQPRELQRSLWAGVPGRYPLVHQHHIHPADRLQLGEEERCHHRERPHTFAKFKLLSALEKARQAHSLTVAHAVATLYGKGTVEQTIQTFDKSSSASSSRTSAASAAPAAW